MADFSPRWARRQGFVAIEPWKRGGCFGEWDGSLQSAARRTMGEFWSFLVFLELFVYLRYVIGPGRRGRAYTHTHIQLPCWRRTQESTAIHCKQLPSTAQHGIGDIRHRQRHRRLPLLPPAGILRLNPQRDPHPPNPHLKPGRAPPLHHVGQAVNRAPAHSRPSTAHSLPPPVSGIPAPAPAATASAALGAESACTTFLPNPGIGTIGTTGTDAF
jgi:hypothetical protein